MAHEHHPGMHHSLSHHHGDGESKKPRHEFSGGHDTSAHHDMTHHGSKKHHKKHHSKKHHKEE